MACTFTKSVGTWNDFHFLVWSNFVQQLSDQLFGLFKDLIWYAGNVLLTSANTFWLCVTSCLVASHVPRVSEGVRQRERRGGAEPELLCEHMLLRLHWYCTDWELLSVWIIYWCRVVLQLQRVSTVCFFTNIIVFHIIGVVLQGKLICKDTSITFWSCCFIFERD